VRSAQVRQRYELDGRDLAREIRKAGARSGELRAVSNSENTRFVQRIEVGNTVVRLIYENGRVSASTVSSGRSSLPQVIISSQTMGGTSSET
jgi:hypothetical protein